MRNSALLLVAGAAAVASASPLGRTPPLWKRQSAASASSSLAFPSATPVPLPTPIPSPNATIPGRNNSALWDWTTDKMHGVSLGNWLLLERWMDEEWFIESSGDPSAEDEWTWSEALGDRKTAVLQEHWNSWITDDDVRFIAESGFDHIRIPVGYWAFINEPAGTPYASMAGQLEQMDRVLESAYNYGLYAIIDLHGLPGSQNGEQPSGRIGYNNFYQDENIRLGDATVDAAIEWMTNSPHRSIISALAACNEPIYYGNEQYRALLGYYERTYEKLAALSPPMAMMFAPGKPESDPFELWQGFINGKNPSLLVYEDHPYVGRNWGTTDQNYMLSQVCSRAERYQNYGVPVAITEWSLSTDILNNPDWVSRFWSTQLTAFPNPVFWSYRVNAYHNSNEQQTAENFTLYSFVDVARNGHIPLPAVGQTSQEYINSLDNFCGNTNSTQSYGATVTSVQLQATQAFP